MLRVFGDAGWVWQDGQLLPMRPASERRVVALPQPPGPRPAFLVPSAEVMTVPRHLRAGTVKTYLAGTPGMVALFRLATPLFRRAGPRLRRMVERRIARQSEGPSEEARGDTRFTLQVEAHSARGRRTITIRGRDPYGLTARLLAFAAGRMMDPAWQGRGALAPAQAFAPEAILETLEPFGLSVETS
jgi:short subunit dehydrogenase-like uncharacterized protein